MTAGTHAPHAVSVDGRHFSYEVALGELDARIGGYVVVGDADLGQITDIALEPSAPGAGGPRLARVAGRLVSGTGRAFGDAQTREATPAEVARWLERVRPERAMLEVGSLAQAGGLPLALDAGAFDRHTFLCGQSGSGKTYALGTLLERLLVETTLRVVVLDPNSDFVGLGQLRDDVPPDVAARYAAASAGVAVRRAGDSGRDRLHVRFRDFDADERAALLRLDPIDDRDEYAALHEVVERGAELLAPSIRQTIEGLRDHPEPIRSLGIRARNLGVDRWQVWSGEDQGSLEELVQPDGPRCVVADLGSLETREERTVAAEAALASLWRRRKAREPVLIVVDEAHNVCPARPGSELETLATEHAVRIAGEGRKFGLVLLVGTQRPQKVHENVVSQCDNLVLMRMTSRSDLAALSDTFSFVPPSLLALSADFAQGESLVAGKVVPGPMLGRFGPRWSLEGGSDPPGDWARRRDPADRDDDRATTGQG